MSRPRRLSLLALAAALLLPLVAPACGDRDGGPAAPPPADGWHNFEGSWNASGRRKALQLGEQRRAVVLEVSGSVLLTGPSRPGVGFLGEAVTFSDSRTGLVGRAVWTDEHGDQVFSELAAPSVETGERITGKFVGGTGRYASAEGEYEFGWAFLIDSDDGTVQGHTLDLRGKVRVGAGAPAEGAPADGAPTEGAPR